MKRIFLFASLIFFVPLIALAQTPVQEFTISPFLEELEVEKGGSIISNIQVINPGDSPLVISLNTQDFSPSEDGTAVFLPDSETRDKTFSLASWISFPSGNTLTIAPGQTAVVDYQVSPPSNAEEGTHYGAILFSAVDSSKERTIGVKQAIAAIIIVDFGAGETRAELDSSVNPKVTWWHSPIEIKNTITNSGTVHVKPKGEVIVKDIFGRVIATPSVNRDASNVLPKSDRVFASTWQPELWRFGPYKADTVIYYGEKKFTLQSSQTIWLLPLHVIGVIILLLLFLIWFFASGRHWYRRKVVEQLRKSS